MRERPILFRAEMVRAILDGKKTMTRRPVKPEPPEWIKEFGYTCFTPEGHISGRGNYKDEGPGEKFFKCRYGVKGDFSWVRETWRPWNDPDLFDVVQYRADMAILKPKISDENQGHWFHEQCELNDFHPSDGIEAPWRPPIFMPRWASRIDLEITNVRVERLNEISEADAMAEGIGEFGEGAVDAEFGPTTPVKAFRELYSRIHGPDSWAVNPWVWVIEFKRVRP